MSWIDRACSELQQSLMFSSIESLLKRHCICHKHWFTLCSAFICSDIDASITCTQDIKRYKWEIWIQLNCQNRNASIKDRNKNSLQMSAVMKLPYTQAVWCHLFMVVNENKLNSVLKTKCVVNVVETQKQKHNINLSALSAAASVTVWFLCFPLVGLSYWHYNHDIKRVQDRNRANHLVCSCCKELGSEMKNRTLKFR